MADIWSAIAGIINSILSFVFSFLPPSPFKGMFTAMADNEILQYLNWFVPVSDFVAMLSVWLGAIIVFYAYQIVLRWIKATAD